MKKIFNKLPIKYKIIILNFAILFPSLIIISSIISYRDIKDFNRKSVNNASVDAKLYGRLATTYVAFGFNKNMVELLRNFKYNENIVNAKVINNKNEVFFNYVKDSTKVFEIKNKKTINISLKGDYVLVNYPLERDNVFYGYLKFTKYTGNLNHRDSVIIISIIILFMVGIISIIAISYLQSFITKPILHLAEISSQISITQNYNTVVSTNLKDELGLLYTQFNKLLNNIKKSISEKEETYQKLKKNQELLLNIEKIAHIGTWRQNFKSNILEWSDEEYNIFNITKKSKISHQQFIQFIHPEDNELFLIKWNDFLNTGKPYENEFRIIVNKEIKWIYEKAYLTKDSHGELFYAEGFSFNITKRKLQELELFEHKNNLTALVTKRTNEVISLYSDLAQKNEQLSKMNDTLSEKKSKLEENTIKLKKAYSEIQNKASELELAVKELQNTQSQLVNQEKMASLGVLTAGIAHEINNPINFISSGITGIENLLEDLEQYFINQESNQIEKENSKNAHEAISNLKYLLQNINIGVKRTVDIIKSLRTFSRESSENFSLANINENIDSTLVLLKNQYKNKIEIIKNYGKIPHLFCEISKINQVFLNLIINAIHAIREKGKIKISTYTENNFVVIKISDNGMGINNDIKDKIFEPFFTTKEVGKGTGLGLSISYSIITAHKGKLKFSSKVNEGTDFFVFLPIDAKTHNILN